MPRCPTCGSEADLSADTCPSCAGPLPWNSDVTHIGRTPSAALQSGAERRSGPHLASSSGALTTTEIDHGRFAPGAILDGRYRIFGRLGRGGMGEVYRADDLRLGSAVALKFLPPDVDHDPAKLTQLHGEVRIARQVSHPNVCRVHDIGEFEGHTFLSMEYVDGEDLASLLRRVGRFPSERGIEITRQICAGLAAAHDRGVVHRDLKPANVMLDGNGRIRITDFGLAGASGEALRAGTPAYMAPEQIAGREVTPRSDIYALGLVLYELFTGRRAIDARNVAELIAKREQLEITRPSEIVRDLDPAIEGVILRCLQPDPAQRPPSALAVSAALPGGDPLAAALAAGETPSPEMVAASGRTSALSALLAVSAFAATIALLFLSAALTDRQLVTSLTPLPKPPLLLEDRAKGILSALGYPKGFADAAHGFGSDSSYLDYLKTRPDAKALLAGGEPAAISYWRRASPVQMIPTGQESNVSVSDPPMTIEGMTLVVTDSEGRLVRFEAVPPQRDPPTHTTPDWKPLFDAAGLTFAAFTPATPEWTPHQYADARAAWTGPHPGLAGETLRVEAAAYNGLPVFFQLVHPWTRAARTAAAAGEAAKVTWASILSTLIAFGMILASALIARHNLQRGRGDHRTALQLTLFVIVVAVIVGVLNDKYIADPNVEMVRFFSTQPLWAAGLLWLLYLALEPYVRRFWPNTIVSWTRLMAHQWRDPLVGRDILFGIGIGVLLRTLDVGSSVLDARKHFVAPDVPNMSMLLGTHAVVAYMLNQIFNAILNALFAIFGMVLLKLLVRSEWLAAVIAIGLTVAGAAANSQGASPVIIAMVAMYCTIVVLTIQRLGLLSTVAVFLVTYMLSNAVVTLDSSRWTFGNSMLQLAVPAALACYGFYAARGGEPLFGGKILD